MTKTTPKGATYFPCFCTLSLNLSEKRADLSGVFEPQACGPQGLTGGGGWQEGVGKDGDSRRQTWNTGQSSPRGRQEAPGGEDCW